MTMFKVTTSPPNEVRWSARKDAGLVYSARGFFDASGCQCLELLPHNAHISTASCLNNPGERNDVLEVSVRVQKAYARGPIVI